MSTSPPTTDVHEEVHEMKPTIESTPFLGDFGIEQVESDDEGESPSPAPQKRHTSATSSTSPPPPKRAHTAPDGRVLTVQTRLAAVTAVKRGTPARQVAARLGINESQIAAWMTDEVNLKKIYQEQLKRGSRVSTRTPNVVANGGESRISSVLTTARNHKEREAADGLANYIQANEQCKQLANRLVRANHLVDTLSNTLQQQRDINAQLQEQNEMLAAQVDHLQRQDDTPIYRQSSAGSGRPAMQSPNAVNVKVGAALGKMPVGVTYTMSPIPDDAERPWGCDHCDKRFHTKSNLKNHLVVHTGDKPYPCSVCGHGFTQLGNKRTHEKRVHGIDWRASNWQENRVDAGDFFGEANDYTVQSTEGEDDEGELLTPSSQ